MARRARTVGLAVLCLCVIASAAQAAQLRISVPRRVHDGRTYTIAITGSFRHSEVRGRPFLIAAIQFSGDSCQRTAQLENNLSDPPQFYLGSQAGVYERHSPFTRRDSLVSRAPGSRHICAYLYPRFSGPTDDTKPIATADAAYRVVRH